MKPYELTIEAAHRLLNDGEISSAELTRSILERIAALDGQIDAYLAVAEDYALEQAQQALLEQQISGEYAELLNREFVSGLRAGADISVM